MAVVGLIVHQGRPEAAAAARELSLWLDAEGHRVRMPPEEAEAASFGHLAAGRAHFAEGLDAVVTLGGDGSILRAVELVGESGVPILGVNYGRIGYLTEVAPADAHSAIDRVLAGDHGIEERMLLTVEFGDPEPGSARSSRRRFLALNEAVVERPAASYALRLGVSFDGEHFTVYAADGLIVATPTGSTAYALAAGGPVVDPTHRALLITPVSPHMLFDRSLVVDDGTRVQLEVLSDRGAVLSVDGRRLAGLEQHDVVVCGASPRPARLVTFGARRFHQVLKTKFGLNDR
ncbi:MAG: NAD(+)/NADH kinase [Acidimicrobiaceae bacterium]|nr:NAD(+)/NADH kinase [Acidimicrobiaceae bacterium]MYE97663.1 NAD(+)/NADH kinase [Acidimicrobiaceae bacterium]MYI53753.1 NAD(+)/NADH kinase [Acidimicrobiaceae bacterium]MYJ81399.1 NAD(+)/NADH kinase [Acidimicrobiaceae bacterium]